MEDFTYQTVFDYEEGVTRRDPSPVLKIGELYYVWYSHTTKGRSGYHASIWYATSTDGYNWKERGEALAKGEVGSWDEQAVFTPTMLVTDNRYYLFYTAVPKPFTNGGSAATPTAIGIAYAEQPEGPWKRFSGNPILRPSVDKGHFDSHRVDDACLVVRKGKYWLYYKGRQQGLSPAETKMGLAVAEHPEGPYIKHHGNPVLPSGHEVCVFPFGMGIAAIVSPAGHLGNTLQYSENGIDFHIMANIKPPSAPGPYRVDHYREGWGEGITWGLCHHPAGDWPYLSRFDCKLQPAK